MLIILLLVALTIVLSFAMALNVSKGPELRAAQRVEGKRTGSSNGFMRQSPSPSWWRSPHRDEESAGALQGQGADTEPKIFPEAGLEAWAGRPRRRSKGRRSPDCKNGP